MFHGRFDGHDAIFDFAAGDVVLLRGFGERFDSFEEIMDATLEFGGSPVIELSADATVSLVGVSKASLTADMFAF